MVVSSKCAEPRPKKTDARTQFAFLGRSAAAGVPAAAVVRFCELLKAGGDRLVNASQLVGEVLTEAAR